MAVLPAERHSHGLPVFTRLTNPFSPPDRSIPEVEFG